MTGIKPRCTQLSAQHANHCAYAFLNSSSNCDETLGNRWTHAREGFWVSKNDGARIVSLNV